MTSNSTKKHIIVVGGSLAGLMSAIPLKRLGHRITILERSPVPLLHDQGAGVVAGGDTLEWVERYGVSKNAKTDISVLSLWRLYLDRQGNIIDKENSHQRMTSWGVLYEIGRESFDGIRKGGEIPDASKGDSTKGEGHSEDAHYVYGSIVTGVREDGDQVEVKYTKASGSGDGADKPEHKINGDFLIAADGPSSSLRKNLLGDDTAQRTYAGYVAFRGTVPESELTDAAKDVFVEKFSFFHGRNPNTQILAYTIPNADGSLEKGERFVNWVWYHNVKFDSSEYGEIMTDKDGKKHRFTLPTGGFIADAVWQRQKQTARDRLPPQFAELILKTEKPFVQAITDLKPPKSKNEVAGLLGGKAVIVGDALAGFRPHTAASTSQAAFNALRLTEVFKGEITWKEYEAVVYQYAVSWQAHGERLGDRSQFGTHPLAN